MKRERKNSDTSLSSSRSERLRAASQQRRDQERQEVRQAILQASSELFLEQGYAGFSLRQVAEKIGYSPGTIYLYFADRDAIVFTLIQEGVAILAAALRQAVQTPNIQQRLVNVGKAYIEFGLQYPAYYQLIFMQRTDYFGREPDETGTSPAALFGLWQNLVQEAMQAGILRQGDPTSTGDVLWSLLHGVVSIAILMPNFDASRKQALVEKAVELLTNGIH